MNTHDSFTESSVNAHGIVSDGALKAQLRNREQGRGSREMEEGNLFLTSSSHLKQLAANRGEEEK